MDVPRVFRGELFEEAKSLVCSVEHGRSRHGAPSAGRADELHRALQVDARLLGTFPEPELPKASAAATSKDRVSEPHRPLIVPLTPACCRGEASCLGPEID
jgi:hypothetical protein